MGKEDCLELSMVFNGYCAGCRVYCLGARKKKETKSKPAGELWQLTGALYRHGAIVSEAVFGAS